VPACFAPGNNRRPLTAVPLTSPPVSASAVATVTFSRSLDANAELLAVEPDDAPANITLRVEAVRPDGSHAPVARFTARPDWNRRYWSNNP
jgi:hypothetical protein